MVYVNEVIDYAESDRRRPLHQQELPCPRSGVGLEDACISRFGVLPHGDAGAVVRSDNGLVFASRLRTVVMPDVVNDFVDWGGEFHQPPWQVNNGFQVQPGATTVYDVLKTVDPLLNPTSQGTGAGLCVTGIGGVEQDSASGYY